MSHSEIILYQADDQSNIEVRVEDETVWLTQAQMVELFRSSKQNISLHIKNIFKEGELQIDSTVKEYLTAQKEGERQVTRKVSVYNLDVIISVGYRVKSQRGTQFRIWANRILKEYLLNGHVLSHRVDRIERTLIEHDKKFDLLITNISPKEGIFYDGQVFDAYLFVADIIKLAKTSIVLIDNYIDESVLVLLSKKSPKVKATIYTAAITDGLKLDIQRFNAQYRNLEVKTFKKSHDRFVIIDNTDVFHIGASLKDLGKKWFAFSKIAISAQDIINRLA